jgi:hypothetical protein
VGARGEFDAALAIAPKDPDKLFEKMDFPIRRVGHSNGEV